MRAGLGDITAAECCRWPGAGASPGGLQLLQSLSPWTPGTLGLMTIRSSVHYQVRRHEEGSRVVVMETSDASPLSTARISPQPPAAEQRSVIGGRRRDTVRLLATVETVETHNTVHRYMVHRGTSLGRAHQTVDKRVKNISKIMFFGYYIYQMSRK